MNVKSLSRFRLLATRWSAAYQAPPSMGFSRQEYWSGVPSPSPSLSLQVVTIKLCSEDLTMYFYRAFLKVQLLGGSDFVFSER